MKLGDRLGYPGLDKPMNLVYGKPAASNITSNSTSNSTSPHRRAPPPENFGQIPGLVQLLGFEFWTTDAYSGDKSMWLRTDIFYTPWGRNIFVAGDEGSCQVVCDGPALVFLKPLCWSQWLAASQAEQAAMVQYPGAVRKINEQGLGGGVPCPKGPKAVVEPATTRSVEAEIVGVTTANGLPSTFTTTRPIPITAGASGFTLEPTVMRDSVGRPTATTSRWVISDLTLKDDKGNPTATVTARLRVTPTTITMVDVSGRPTATITTEVPLERSLVTLKDASGRPTATIATEVPLVTGLVTLTDANGVPVATVTGSGVSKVVPTGPRRTGRFDEPGLPSQQDTFHPISWGDYVLAAFVPVLVTVPLTILTQILRSEIRTLLPFNALTRQPNGATATESLCLNTGGIPGFVNSFRLLFRKEPLAFLGDLLMLSSAIIVSFSSEAFGIKLYGACTADNFQGCHMGIASFQTPSRVVQAFLSVALVALFIMMGLIRYWRTGVDSSGRSIAAIASLLGEKETQDVFRKIVSQPDSGEISNGEMIRQLDGRFFLLTSSPVSPAFGITTSHIPATARDEQTQPPGHEIRRRGTLPLLKVFSLSQSSDAISQVAFLLSVVSFFILIVYYESTTLDTAFERFMDSQHLGVRVLFTGVGVVLSLFWDDYFSRNTPAAPCTPRERQILTAWRRRGLRQGALPPTLPRTPAGQQLDPRLAAGNSLYRAHACRIPPRRLRDAGRLCGRPRQTHAHPPRQYPLQPLAHMADAPCLHMDRRRGSGLHDCDAGIRPGVRQVPVHAGTPGHLGGEDILRL